MFGASKSRVDSLEIQVIHLDDSRSRLWKAIEELINLFKNINEKASLLEELQSVEHERTNALIARLEERIARLEERTTPVDDREA